MNYCWIHGRVENNDRWERVQGNLKTEKLKYKNVQWQHKYMTLYKGTYHISLYTMHINKILETKLCRFCPCIVILNCRWVLLLDRCTADHVSTSHVLLCLVWSPLRRAGSCWVGARACISDGSAWCLRARV